ncbi:hypothetical protein ACP86_05810 [Marinobacter sp. CP1]|jgi:hypothetical protein|uniref:hypothetical protein n=1 Tax=unclassified Marinobacter TaxID=83889 RepID=UPI00069D8B48|nr:MULTISPECIES: hypothetical protein [unclassified Marinobacter]AKV95717.1 hypothetical protein ACP86_05810 [Marinobacter sp. CP1]
MLGDRVWAAIGFPFSKVLRAKDGPKQAHMDVLVASFEKGNPTAACNQAKRKKKPANPEERRVFIKPENDQAEKSVG